MIRLISLSSSPYPTPEAENEQETTLRDPVWVRRDPFDGSVSAVADSEL
jgi:hypothetical protein